MRRSSVTTSRCLIRPLETKDSMRSRAALLARAPRPSRRPLHKQSTRARREEACPTYFASGSYSDHILLNSSKW